MYSIVESSWDWPTFVRFEQDGPWLAYSEPVDMRKSFAGLVSVVQNVLHEDPLSDCLFIFFNRRKLGLFLRAVL